MIELVRVETLSAREAAGLMLIEKHALDESYAAGASISILVTFACHCFLLRNERVEGSVGLQQLMMTIIRQMFVVMLLDVRDGAEKRDDDCHEGPSIA